MINFEDYFGGLTSEEYEEETREHLEWLKNNALNKFEQPACKNCSSNEPHPTEAIVLYFNFDDIAFGDLTELYEITKKNFPNNTVVCVPDKVSLESWSKDVLENYISMISEIIEEL